MTHLIIPMVASLFGIFVVATVAAKHGKVAGLVTFTLLALTLNHFFISKVYGQSSQDWYYWQDDTIGYLLISSEPYGEHVPEVKIELVHTTIDNWQGWQWTVTRDDSNSDITAQAMQILTTGNGCNCGMSTDMETFFLNYARFHEVPPYTTFLPIIINN